MSTIACLPQQEYAFERSPWNNPWVLFVIALIVSCFDFLTGPMIFFPIFFLIPLSLMAWNCGLRTAVSFGVVLCVIRFFVQSAWGYPGPLSIAYLNAAVRVGILLLIVYLFAKLAERTRALRERIRTLEGFLPTCSFCKDIRDECGNWHQIESYISARSEARFSHGVCPQCAAKHYGDILNGSKKS
jgi:hypothetical protein